jgi:integrase
MIGGNPLDAPSAPGTGRASIRFRIVREVDPEEAESPPPGGSILSDYETAQFGRASPAQLRFNTASVRALLAQANLADLSAVRAETIEDWLAALARSGASPKTCRNRLAGVGAVLTWLRKRRLIAHNPARDVEPPTLNDPPHVYLREADRDRAMRIAADHGIECEVGLALYAGLRMSELRRLRWQDVFLEDRCLVVLKAKGRSGRTKWRRVWLHSRAIDCLRRQKDRTGLSAVAPTEWVFPGGRRRRDGLPGGGTWTRNQPRGRESWLALLRPLQAALPTFALVPKGQAGRGWHLLRHTFASLGLQHGIGMKRISEWLGHSTISTTERHYAWLEDAYDPEIEKL